LTTITQIPAVQKTVSPVDGRVYVERLLATPDAINEILRTARHAQASWRNVPIEERARILSRFCHEFEKRGTQIAEELTWQMGRPARYAPNEVRGTLERARHMIDIAPQALADLDAGPKEHFTRFVRREPLGVVFTIAAWNYPYLIAVNSVVPALMAGNAVILKHSARRRCAPSDSRNVSKRRACRSACSRSCTPRTKTPTASSATQRINFVAFTGSVAGGHAVQRRGLVAVHRRRARTRRLRPVYVRHDANLRMPSRTSSTVRISTRASRVAACSASTCTTASTRSSSTASPTSPASTCSPIRARPAPRWDR
jgi:acyl-CoA reductase-like NAD-dependent aldehyde dehydrogenase